METKLTVVAPVKIFVKDNLGCAEFFKELNIDLCCGGDKPLFPAC